MKYAEVLVGYPLEIPFTYRVPEEIPVIPFSRVKINFGGRNITGFVTNLRESPPDNVDIRKLKDILGVLDESPIFDERLVDLAYYLADNYLCSPGEALAMALPSAPRPSSRHKNPFGTSEHVTTATLTPEQDSAMKSILESRVRGELLHLIYGITGSGKTEIYIALARNLMAKGLSVIYLVPEISISSQIYERLNAVFGNELVIYHSGLTAPQRLHAWMRFYRGEAKIAVGTRSAVFLQCPRLGMMVIDEEHDSSYKEHSTPRYNARRVALRRTKTDGALLLLGSATPSVETLYAAERGVFKSHRLETRFGGAGLPTIEIAKIKSARKPELLLSNTLKVESKRTLDRGEQIIFLLNRRGFSPIVMCDKCGVVETCPHCSISLNHHRGGTLLCHYCAYKKPVPENCQACGAPDLLNIGSGTQRVEETILGNYRQARIFRLDQDTARKKGSSFDLLEKMKKGDIDILLGTQMVAKGFHFPNVSLVGVLLADIGLNMPDFRASERVFALLTQVAGRSGRGGRPGKVIVQTVNEENPIFRYLKNHDYTGFYRQELESRRQLKYPPFSRLARLLLRGVSEERVIAAAELLGGELRRLAEDRRAPVEILGPAPAPLAMISRNHRWHIILRAPRMEEARDIIREARPSLRDKDVYLEIDIDPLDLM